MIISLRSLFTPEVYEFLKPWIFSKTVTSLPFQLGERLFCFSDIVAPYVSAHLNAGYLLLSIHFPVFLACQVGCCHCFPVLIFLGLLVYVQIVKASA